MISYPPIVNNNHGCLILLRQNAWKKRGVSCIPLMFGISFSMSCFNQVSESVC